MGRGARWLPSMLLVIIAFACLLRFHSLELKPYWLDESLGLAETCGHLLRDVDRTCLDKRFVTKSDLLAFQQLNASESPLETLKALANNDAGLDAPVYFLVAREACRYVHNPVVATRAVSAVFGALLIALAYFLSLSYFGSRFVAIVVAAIIAVSPIQFIFSQEARAYSLWECTFVLSSLALWHAARVRTVKSWMLYGAATTLSLYTHLMSFQVAIIQAIYLFWSTKSERKQTVLSFGFVMLMAIGAFAPWLFVLIKHFAEAKSLTAWQSNSTEIQSLYFGWLKNIARIFFDTQDSSVMAGAFFLPVVLISLYYVAMRASKDVAKYVFLFVIVPPLLLAGADLVCGGFRSNVERYMLPSVLTLEIAIGFTIADCMQNKRHRMEHALASTSLIVILVLGIVSCISNSQSSDWWNKGYQHINEVAQSLNKQSEHVLLLYPSQAGTGVLLSLAHQLKPDVTVEILPENGAPIFPRQYRLIYLLTPTNLLSEFTHDNPGVELKPVSDLPNLFLLSKSQSHP